MLKKELKLIITFYTSSEAMATERICREANIDGKLISAPRDLTSDCGISFATDISNKDVIEKLLKEKKVEYEKIVEIEV
ncbi:MAG: DUF3343 domain-containing protein [Lachnospiraceae bacterium]|nr:DUF3343 domain-containing protein [Lachnospiraceae bacterium]